MEQLVVFAIVAAFVVGTWALKARKVAGLEEGWLDAARRAGLEKASFSGVVSPRLAASTRDGIRISAWCQDAGNVGEAELHVQASGVLPRFVYLSPETTMTQLGKRIGGNDIETGDAEFDRRVLVHGTPLQLVAILGHRTRRAVLELLEAGGTAGSGQLIARFRGNATSEAKLVQRLRDMVELVRLLREPDDPAPRLADNVLNDPVPGVRRRSLEMLVQHFPRHEVTPSTLDAAATDTDPAVRLLGATHRGAKGVPVLVELALSPRTPPPIAAAATRAAGAALGSGSARAILDRALSQDHPDLALAAVEALGRCTDGPAAARLAEVLAGPDVPLATAAAKALAAARGDAAEPELVAALGHASREVRLAAAAALAEVGAVTAVAALRAAVAAHPADLGLRRAAAAAVGAIQQRALGAAPGQVSLAEGPGGALALADDDGGRLGLADEPSTQGEG